jgi:solute carrier family 25 S-adenosylmethionine transporter 26
MQDSTLTCFPFLLSSQQAAAQLVTTPLDVVRNRLMTGSESTRRPTTNPADSTDQAPKQNYIQTLIALGKEEGVEGLFAGATPRVAKAFLSGAIQFATYEETKQSISRLLQQRR